MGFVLFTERLVLREMAQCDFNDLCEMLCDPDVMYAWEHTFTKTQVQEWLDRQLLRYEQTGVGIWVVIENRTNAIVGQIGLVWTDIEGKNVLDLAYMLKKAHWGKGFAIEGCKACLEYAFNNMGVDKVYTSIRPENISSRKVVEKLKFEVCGQYIKNYNNQDMLHLIYTLDKNMQ